jgi:hypothetical protein
MKSPRNTFSVLFIILYISSFYLGYLFTGTTSLLPSYQDESQWLLYSIFANHSFSRGFFPLWIPDLNCGMPFLGWSHAAALSPAGLIFALWDYAQAVWVNEWIHALIYSLGLFYLCRRLGASGFSALLAVLIGGALEVLAAVGNFLPATRTGSWAPWLLLTAIALVQDRRKSAFFGFILVNLFMYLGGHIELLGLGYELMAVALLGWGIAAWRRGQPAFPGYLAFAGAFLLSYLLAQVQTLPTMELTGFSIRAEGLTYPYFKIWSSTGAEAAVWIPYLLSAAVLGCVASAGAGARRSGALGLLVLGFGFCVCVIHNLFGTLWVIYHLPVLNGLLGHARIGLYAGVLLAVMIALGADRMIRSPHSGRWFSGVGLLSLLLAAVWWGVLSRHADLLLAGAEPTSRPMTDRFLAAMDWAMAVQAATGLILLSSPWIARGRPGLPRWALALSLFAVYSAPALYAVPHLSGDRFDFAPAYGSFFAAHPGLDRVQTIYAWDRWDQIRIPLQSGVLYGTRSADGFITLSVDRYTRFLNAIIPGSFREEKGRIADLEQLKVFKEGAFITDRNLPFLNFLGIRYLVAEQRNLKFASPFFLAYPDSPLRAGPGPARRELWPSEGGQDALVFSGRASGKVHVQAGDRLEFQIANQGDWILGETRRQGEAVIRLEFARWVSAAGLGPVRVDLGRNGEGNEELSFIALDRQGRPSEGALKNPTIVNPAKYFQRLPLPGRFNIFENPGAMPPAFLAPQVAPAEKREVLARLLEPSFDPSTEAVVEDPRLAGLGGALLQNGEGVRIVGYTPEQVDLVAAAARPRLMVLTDAYFPGWRVFVDGRESRLFPVDYAFRGVVLDAGQHRITMRYQPISFHLGLWITLASLFCWAAMLLTSAFRLQQRETSEKHL